jgi:hypothetical protein
VIGLETVESAAAPFLAPSIIPSSVPSMLPWQISRFDEVKEPGQKHFYRINLEPPRYHYLLNSRPEDGDKVSIALPDCVQGDRVSVNLLFSFESSKKISDL